MITYVRGDCLLAPARVAPRSAALVYCDPPFAVGRPFHAQPRAGAQEARFAYDDRWPDLETYLAWLAPRLEALWGLVADEGWLVLHLDGRAVHDAKVVGDRAMGRGNFHGEIIWLPGNGAKGRGLPMTHQTLLFWGRGAARWNRKDPALREPYAAVSRQMHFTHVDDDGRRYRERVVNGKAYRYYEDEGRALGSVWTDCPAMAANSPLRSESTGYPTQKPKSLLTRLIRATTAPGALVVDAFTGSGSLLEAAFDAGRPAVGFDVGAASEEVVRRRLGPPPYSAEFASGSGSPSPTA